MRRVVLGLVGVVLGLAAGGAWAAYEPAQAQLPMVEAPPPPDAGGMDTVALGLAVRSGDTLGELLARWDLPAGAIREAARAHYDLANIRPDRELSLVFVDADSTPVALRYAIDEDRTLLVERGDSGWTARVEALDWSASVGSRKVILRRSLWEDGLEAGLKPADLMKIASIFEYEIDFNTELHKGAEFALVADVLQAEGREKLGVIHAVRMRNHGKEYVAVRHVGKDGREAYYHPDGNGMRKPFLRSPLAFDARVTSSFNPHRFHPVLKTRRPHNGTDFGAPTRTQVRSVADGVVVFAGVSGGHGNFVKIRHEGGWETSYSHLSRISVKKGQSVRQAQNIGAVGSTGMSTGPHLHFQMWKDGRYVDAMKIKLPTSGTLSTVDRAAFREEAARWVAKLPS